MKQFVAILALLIVFSMVGCGKPHEDVSPSQPEPPQITTVPPQIPDQEPVEQDEIQEDVKLPTVTITPQTGMAATQDTNLTYRLDYPVFENIPEDVKETLSAYYNMRVGSRRSYITEEAILHQADLPWDGEFFYKMDCEVAYLDENYVSTVRRFSQPAKPDILDSETFSLETGGFVTLDYLFQEDSAYREILFDTTRETFSEIPEDTWEEVFAHVYRGNQFYITEAGLSIYFQADQIGQDAPEIVEFSWAELPETVL